MKVVVVNPAAGGAAKALRRISRSARTDLHVCLTRSPEDVVVQTQRAIDEGASAVIACGGDGTVRLVAGALLGSGTRLGVIPAGRANIASRYLHRHGHVRVAHVHLELVDGTRRLEPFLVMVGTGHDAEVIGQVGRAGWWGYYLAGAKRLAAPAMRTRIDGRETMAWSVLVGNLPAVPPGLTLFPGLAEDQLGVCEVQPGSLWGWPHVATGVLRRADSPRLPRYARDEVKLEFDQPRSIQIDGDVIPAVLSLNASVAGRISTESIHL